MKHRKAKLGLVALALVSVATVAAPSSRQIFKDQSFGSSEWRYTGSAKRGWSDMWHTNRVILTPRYFTGGTAEYVIKMPANYRPELFKYKVTFQARARETRKSCIGARVEGGERGKTPMQRVNVSGPWRNYSLTFAGLPAKGDNSVLLHLDLCDNVHPQVDNITVTEISKD